VALAPQPRRLRVLIGSVVLALALGSATAAREAIVLTGSVRDVAGAAIDKAEVLLATSGLTVVATTRSDREGLKVAIKL
jgi:hypothetical protein